MVSSQARKQVTTVKDLLSLHDKNFIVGAYRAILNRAPDPDGMAYYLARIRGGVSKLEILAQLYTSKEGKTQKISADGLEKAVKRHLQLRKYLPNGLLQLIGGQTAQEKLQKKLRAIENKLHADDANLQYRFEELNRSLIELTNSVRKINDPENIIHHSCTISAAEPSNETANKIDASFFSAEWYLEQNPDVSESGMEPYEHYISYGKKEGRHPKFDSEWYLSEYPDVAKCGVNPHEHYNLHGKHEGRHPAFDSDWYIATYPDVRDSGMSPIDHYYKIGKAEGRHPAYSRFSTDRNNYLKWIKEFDTLSEKDRKEMRARIGVFKNKPLISIVMPVYNPNPIWLKEVIDSIRSQIYTNWELCIADDASSIPEVRIILDQYRHEDNRIKVVFRNENGHISAASNSAIALAQGEWLALVDHDDRLTEHALFWVVDAINKHPESRLIYSDEDKIDENGVRSGPYFKCDWNQDLFYSHNMITHLGVYHAALVKSVGGFRIGLEGSQDYDLALRCIEHIAPNQIHHIPRILYHWRVHAESTAQSSDAKPYAMIAGERAINEHFQRKGTNAKAELIGYGYRVHYELPRSLPLVSLIVPTRDGLSFLKQCIDSILEKTSYSNYEILIVDNGSQEAATLKYLERIVVDNRVRVIRDDSPFNYSALNNKAVKLARGEIVGLINNDIEVITADWLSEMVSHVLRPEVGAVGARLWYSNDTLQHGGVVLGLGGVVAHSHRKLPKNNPGYCGRASLIQSFSAVTAACLIIRKSVYEEVNGLNEEELQVAYNDVDFCLRVLSAGYRNIWTPYAELYHHESATRGAEDTPEKKIRFEKEKTYMQSVWGDLLQKDPAYSPNLTFSDEDFSLAWPPRVEGLSN